ncbi:hypothetical protein J4230_01980 [Candidatus Woesearchaeota archaeon]|nr:hypothetical protein [Candidatus Woesearchaeota archaeon]
MVLGLEGTAFSIAYLIAIAIIVLYVLSKIIEWASGRFRHRGEEEEIKSMEREEEAEAALDAENSELMEQEINVTKIKFALIKENLHLAEKITKGADQDSKSKINEVISKIIQLIEQEINVVKQHTEKLKAEPGIIVEEINKSNELIKNEKTKIERSADEHERINAQQTIAMQEKLQLSLGNKLSLVKRELDIIEKIISRLGATKKLWGKSQLSQAKKEKEIITSGNDIKELLNIATYLFDSENEIGSLEREMQQIMAQLDLLNRETRNELEAAA